MLAPTLRGQWVSQHAMVSAALVQQRTGSDHPRRGHIAPRAWTTGSIRQSSTQVQTYTVKLGGHLLPTTATHRMANSSGVISSSMCTRG